MRLDLDAPKSANLAPASAAQPRLTYSVGGICVGLFAAPDMKLKLDREMEQFRTAEAPVDVRLEVDWTNELSPPAGQPTFRSGGLWSLFEEDGGYRFYFSTPFLGTAPYKAAWFDRAFRQGRVALDRRYHDPKRAVNPMEYPLDELLAIHRISHGEGVEVHAVGLIDAQNRGHLFLGHSGAGKSTSARLWQRLPGVRVLSDDRIILRWEGSQVRMFGTPWHGDAGIASSESAALSAMYVLEHGARNQLTRLAPGRAAAEVFARSFVPHHSADGLQSVLYFLDRVTRQVPCSRFQFVPDQTAVEAICHA